MRRQFISTICFGYSCGKLPQFIELASPKGKQYCSWTRLSFDIGAHLRQLRDIELGCLLRLFHCHNFETLLPFMHCACITVLKWICSCFRLAMSFSKVLCILSCYSEQIAFCESCFRCPGLSQWRCFCRRRWQLHLLTMHLQGTTTIPPARHYPWISTLGVVVPGHTYVPVPPGWAWAAAPRAQTRARHHGS